MYFIAVLPLLFSPADNQAACRCPPQDHCPVKTTTPIKHLVVIFQENRAFDHYFGTYPHAENRRGEVKFTAKENTPTVNGLTKPLLELNTNLVKPFRFSPADALIFTCSPAHTYTQLQQECHSGLMDRFVQVNVGICDFPATCMGYFDGNTVTALWNYAQRFAISDNFCTTNICGSTVGHLNLISGQVHGAILTPPIPSERVVEGTLINNVDPTFDKCSNRLFPTVSFDSATNKNVGDLLNAKNITWGWFQGGFADCSAGHIGGAGEFVPDYDAHHNPFQYYISTSNPEHLPPSSVEMIGKTDQANHNYDLTDFWAAVAIGNLPSVSFLKAAQYQDGHPNESSPLLEQEFLVETINRLQRLPQWKHMAIIIAYDDSGGWYDHEMPSIVNQSQIPNDALIAPGSAGTVPPLGGYQGRPGYGLRVPFVLISPWAKENFVDSTLTDQTSILRFIEDNWHLGRIGNFSFDAFAASLSNLFDFERPPRTKKLILNPKTGKPVCR